MAAAGTAWKSDVLDVIRENQTANGLAVILTNSYERCGSSLEHLSGTKSDGEKMKVSFQMLNFSTCHQHNLPKEATMELLYSVANYHPFPPSYRRIAFVFSGHGGADHKLYTGEGQTLKVSDILAAFFPERAPKNGNISKLFFIDACRGKLSNSGVIVPRSGREIETLTVPKHGNFLVAYSTTPECLSYEERAKGGIWITTLADKLCRRNASVHDVLAEVNSDLISKYQKPAYANFVQQPEFISRLNETVNLFNEAKLATRILTRDSDSDEDLEMGYVVIEPKSELTSSLPVPLPRPRARSSARAGDGLGTRLKRAFKINLSGKKSHSLDETSFENTHPFPVLPVNRTFSTPVPQRSSSSLITNSADFHAASHYHSVPRREESPREKLERYCIERGKPKPNFSVEKVNGKYKAAAYVAKTCGRVYGEMMSSKWEAEMSAALMLVRKLEL